MGSFLGLLLVASMPVLKFLLICAIGLFLASKRIDILGEAARHHLNQMVYYVFQPALVGSHLAQTITFKSLLTMWFMPINILLTFVIGSAFGWVLGKVTKAPKNMKGLIVSSCSAGNLGAMPIIIIPAICKQRGSPFGATDVCQQYGLAYTSLSMALGSVYIWIYIYNIIRITSKKEVENTILNVCGIDKQPDGETVVNVPNDSTTLSPAEESENTSAHTIQHPCTSRSLVASRDCFSNSAKLTAVLFSIWQCLQLTTKQINVKAVLAPSTIAAAIGFFIGMITPLQKFLFANNAPLHVVGDTAFMIGDAAIPALTLILGANLLKGLKGTKFRLIIVVGIMAVRYIFLPLLGILIIKGAVRVGFVQSHDTLLQFVLLLQYALPPALTIGTITQLFGASESECSVIMLWTYAAAPVTFTLWCTYFLWLLSHT